MQKPEEAAPVAKKFGELRKPLRQRATESFLFEILSVARALVMTSSRITTKLMASHSE